MAVETTRAMTFWRHQATAEGPKGSFEVPAGTPGVIEDTAETRRYVERYDALDLVPVRLCGQVRYVPRAAVRRRVQ
jgi:hypothetical protein